MPLRIEEQIKYIQTIGVLKYNRKNKKPEDKLSYFGIDDENQNAEENEENPQKKQA